MFYSTGNRKNSNNGFHGSFFNFDDLFNDDDNDDGGNDQNGFGDFHSFFAEGDGGGDAFAGKLLNRNKR